MTTAHAPEGVTPSSAPEQGTDTAVSTAENANVAENTVEQKVDVDDLKAKVEDPTVGNADELRDFTADELKKDDAADLKNEEVVESGDGTVKPSDIIAAQEAINKLQAESPKLPQGNVEDLVAGKLKAAPPQDRAAADERPPRQFSLDRRNRDERRGKPRNDGRSRLDDMNERVAARRQEPVVPLVAQVVAASAPAVEPPKPVAVTPKSTPVAPVVEDVEIADLRRRRTAPVVQINKTETEISPIDWKKVGTYFAIAAVVALVGYGLMKFFGGGDESTSVPHAPVIAVTPATPPAATAADVLVKKFDELNHRLIETMPSAADLAMLDRKITEAENAAITQIAHVPCFKDPDQPRCRKAVNAERDYFESDFSHPRDIALGKIPYTPPTNKKVDKPAKKAGKKTKK